MKQYIVTGMTCAACSSRVEKSVKSLKGVTECSVSLLTNSMNIEGEVSSIEVIEAVEKAGYKARQKGVSKKDNNDNVIDSDLENMLVDHEIPRLKKRLFASLILLIPLMYISMGHTMWDWPLIAKISNNYIAIGLLQMLLTILIMIINQHFFVSGFKSLINKSPNMDTLVALGSGASFIYSTYVLFAMTSITTSGDTKIINSYMHDLYFESAAMILTLITIGKMLEAISKGRTTDALKSLMKLKPKKATVIINGEEKEVDISTVKMGDIFTVRPGENIPVDGIVLDGISAVNESSLTGESIPVDKKKGDIISAATINQSGFLKCEATRVGEDTVLAKIIQMVSDAAATKAPIAKVADKVSGIFVPTVMIISILTFIIWMISGEGLGFAVARGISVLVISCPCALGLATPVAIMVGSGVGAKHGIMFKTAESLEIAGRTKIIALDKTGTITQGEPKITDIYPLNGYDENKLMTIAASLEQKSEHPLAKAVVKWAESKEIILNEVTNFKVFPGNGLSANINSNRIAGGNIEYIRSVVEVSNEIINICDRISSEGKTPILFCENNLLAGIIAEADTIKDDSIQAVSELQKMGIHVTMLTGDNTKTANAIAKKVNVDEVIAGVLPDGKESVIRKLKKKGIVTMVGDGINDAPALTQADVGIAIGTGTDVAIDAAQIILMKNELKDVPAAIRLSRQSLKNIHENLFWAFIYNIIGIPLAAGVWYPVFGLKLNPMFGAAAMSLSSFCVVTNALRLNFYNIYNSKKDKKIIKHKERKENKEMEKIMEINGMMCGHCEARVKKAIEKLEAVDEAIVSHEKGTAVVKLNSMIDDETLKKSVEDEDYKVISIK